MAITSILIPMGILALLISGILAYLVRKRLTRLQGKILLQWAGLSAIIALLAVNISLNFAFATSQGDALLVSPLFWLMVGWALLSICAIPFGLFGLLRPPDQ